MTFETTEMFIEHCKNAHEMIISESYEEPKVLVIEKSSNIRKTVSKRKK